MQKKLVVFLLPVLIFIYIFKENISDTLVYTLFRFPREGNLSDTIWFFINTTIKVFLLLLIVIFLVGIIRSFFSPEKTRKSLEGKPLLVGNIMASLLGIVTPFCSCSAIPLFLGFVESGIPLGVTFSFLIAAPLINEVAIIMLFQLFGWKIAVIYILSGLSISIISGWIIGKLKLEKWVADWVYNTHFGETQLVEETPDFYQRINFGLTAVKEIISKIWPYVILGIFIGALIHGYVPEDFMASLIKKTGWYSVPLSVLIGIPLYSCSAGAIPIASALIEKGVPLGTALAFMMSVIGISLPELVMLKKVLKIPLILTFIGILATGIIIVGYLFNFIL